MSRNKYIARAQNLDLYGITITATDHHYFFDENGNKYLDFLSSASSLPLGYNRADLVEAYVQQCEQVPHVCTVYTFLPIVEAYAKKLVEISKIPNARIMLGAFGSDAIDAALKCAETYTKKHHFIAFKKAYHGGTYLSLSANGFNNLKAGLNVPDCFIHLDYPNSSNYQAVLANITNILEQNNDIAAILMETILGDGGVIVPPVDFFTKLKQILDKHGVLLIFDEIQTGVGRTGTWWAFEQFAIVPDIFCSAKALGGGYTALSACIGREDVMNSLNNCQNAFTLSAHGASCAVGLALIKAIENEKVLNNVQNIHKIIMSELSSKLQDCAIVKEIRGKGLMLGICLQGDQSYGPSIGKICLEKGVYIGYYGESNNVLRIHPHLNIDDKTAIVGINLVITAIKQFAENPAKYLANENFLSFFTN